MANQFDQFLPNLPNFLFNILVGISAVLIGLLIRLILSRSFAVYAKLSASFFSESVIRHLRKPLLFFLPVLVLNIALPMMRMDTKAYNLVSKAVEILLIIAFALLLMNMIRIIEDYVYHKYNFDNQDNLKARKIRTQLQFVRKLVMSLIVIVAAGVILLSFESMRKIGAGLLTGVGVGGIIIGFAAQKSLGNLLAGFQIAFTQPIRIDDVLVVEGEWGRVEEITLTYLVLKLWDQRRLILPINYFIEKPFQNWTRVSAELIGSVYLYLDYTAPVEELRIELARLLELDKLWDKRVMALQITDTRENSIEVRALVSGKNSSDVFDLRCHVREGLIGFVQKNHPECLPKTRAQVEGEIKNKE